ncbi:MAG: hypothetical protein NZ805_12280 [Armatimonadetes bacterium]|nr:hypothetical protein [Armatimonadota bacterium]MDW8029309.1 hypothetical protein [Armatimonadota bacterium]
MRQLTIFALISLIIVSAHCQREISETDLPKQIAAIAQKLKKAQLAKSLRAKEREILQAQKLVEKLSTYPLTEKIKARLNKVFKVGIMTKDADSLLDEAIELAESANNLLRQKPSDFDPEAAKATLQRVLNSREFRDPLWLVILRRLEKHLERIFNWLSFVFGLLAKFLEPLFQWISEIIQALGAWFWNWFLLLMRISPVFAWTVVIAFSSILSVLLAYKILIWWQKRQKAMAENALAEALVMPEQLLVEAENAAKTGDYLTALRKAYKALLLVLDQIGLIRFREQRTNWEYLAEIQRKTYPNFARKFLEVTKTFELCFYARKLATAKEYTLIKQFTEETLRQAFSNPSSLN